MPACSRLGDLSAGHDGFPPTPIIGGVCSTVFVNGIPAATVGSTLSDHTSGATHVGRTVVSGSGTVFFESKGAARIGDSINCGDTLGAGSDNVFVGG